MTQREHNLYSHYAQLAHHFKLTITDIDELNEQLSILHQDFLKAVDGGY